MGRARIWTCILSIKLPCFQEGHLWPGHAFLWASFRRKVKLLRDTQSLWLSSLFFWRQVTTCQGFPGGSVVKSSSANAGDSGDTGSILGSGRSPGVGNGSPLQYSCLKHIMNRGAWQATVYGIAKSQTRLCDWARACAYTHTRTCTVICQGGWEWRGRQQGGWNSRYWWQPGVGKRCEFPPVCFKHEYEESGAENKFSDHTCLYIKEIQS